MCIYNVHHSCVAGTLTWVLDAAAAVSIFVSEKSCNIMTIKECQVVKIMIWEQMLFSSAVHIFIAFPSFIPFFQFYKCQFVKSSNLNMGLIWSIDSVMDLHPHFKPSVEDGWILGHQSPLLAAESRCGILICRLDMWWSTWLHNYHHGDQVWILVFTSTLAAEKCLKIDRNMKRS